MPQSNSSARNNSWQSEARSLLNESIRRVVEHAEDHPYRALGAAFGLGYLVGSGMSPFLARMARLVLLRSLVETALESEAAVTLARRILQTNAPDKQTTSDTASSNGRHRSRRDRRRARQALSAGSIH